MAERINLLTIALPTTNGIVNLDFIRGSVTYIVGPNGSGKSSLLTFATRNAGSINHKRILAYRQISFGNDQIDITAQNRRQMDNELNNTDMRERIRWMDDYSQVRISNALYDLVHSENNWNKEIATLLRSGKHEEAERKSKQDSPIAILNDVLAIGALPVRISISDDDRILAAHGVNLLYGINRMSDGERNAVLLAAELLTAKANSLIIIDEPERHLHRSITVPILAALFQRRSDCSF